jgi:hypothetical protein
MLYIARDTQPAANLDPAHGGARIYAQAHDAHPGLFCGVPSIGVRFRRLHTVCRSRVPQRGQPLCPLRGTHARCRETCVSRRGASCPAYGVSPQEERLLECLGLLFFPFTLRSVYGLTVGQIPEHQGNLAARHHGCDLVRQIMLPAVQVYIARGLLSSVLVILRCFVRYRVRFSAVRKPRDAQTQIREPLDYTIAKFESHG